MLDEILKNSSFLSLSNLLKCFFQSSSFFFPAIINFLHSFKIFSGISNGAYGHFNFFLTSSISALPKGLPCTPAVLLLLGDP